MPIGAWSKAASSELGGVAVELAQHAQQPAVGEHAHADVERERHAVGAPALERDERHVRSGGKRPRRRRTAVRGRRSARSARCPTGSWRNIAAACGLAAAMRPSAPSASAASGSRRGTAATRAAQEPLPVHRPLRPRLEVASKAHDSYDPAPSVLQDRLRRPARPARSPAPARAHPGRAPAHGRARPGARTGFRSTSARSWWSSRSSSSRVRSPAPSPITMSPLPLPSRLISGRGSRVQRKPGP